MPKGVYVRTEKSRGENHWTHKHPERVARGQRTCWYTHPEKRHIPTNQPKGEANCKAKLTEGQVLEIRSMAAHNSYREIGKLFGVTKQNIFAIVRRKTWNHI